MYHSKSENWRLSAGRRRLLLFGLSAVQTIIATRYTLEILPQHGGTGLEIAIASLFAILFAWISLGFWTAAIGFLILIFRFDRFSITRSPADKTAEQQLARTAIVMPIYNEDVGRVYAGLRATYRSLKATGLQEHFDFFVLSDTNDPDIWIEEERGWANWRVDEDDFEHIHYRRRRHNIKRKTGNIADFCRRWGHEYRYMVVLDADSILQGGTLTRLVDLMETHRDVGIIQTTPHVVNRDTLFARIQQFSNHVYGSLFAAGLSFWQLGDSYYWGHNAIIRVRPFIDHCGLGRLKGSAPMGGEILSHDFIEAAYMRRAGWEVWLAHDIGGSYEESPPTLLDELKRDRRWAQGNLQHIKLMGSWGLKFVYRVMFLYGIMAYGSSFLWIILLGLSTSKILFQASVIPDYFPYEHSLFPVWPEWHPEWAVTLMASTVLLLFLPKLLGVLLVIVKQGQARLYGGVTGLVASMLIEMLFSALFAPVRMLFHSKFVVLTLLGQQVRWSTQCRGDTQTTWNEALKQHGSGAILAVAWGTLVYNAAPEYLLWLLPILVALVLAIPLSVMTSRMSLGRAARELGLFLVPAETSPPNELRWVQESTDTTAHKLGAQTGFEAAIVDPLVNALHLALLPKQQRWPEKTAQQLKSLRKRALVLGPEGLSRVEKFKLLYDSDSVAWLHSAIWQTQDNQVANKWRIPEHA